MVDGEDEVNIRELRTGCFIEKDSTIKDLTQKISFKQKDSSLKQIKIDILVKTIEQSSVAMKEISHQHNLDENQWPGWISENVNKRFLFIYIVINNNNNL
ncbi:hypothetical protein DLAC_05455 [Tieghemostelium lacteum]|uniref:Uncharacterized protein n=1 Tax=Tieghemostelium lacteum TaxID=361077 RepID=A0A151ZFW9_TIELA|nr:hypothetical protein DLAC_05455 [Tieghemostelium lacteum]|eukprot:KYQ92866.1 hypothetical protein DLAC_05455 [Tieghemostelium lacteum]